MFIHYGEVALTLWLAFLVVYALRPYSVFRHKSLRPIPLQVVSDREVSNEAEMEEYKARMVYMGRKELDNKLLDVWVEEIH